MWVERCRDESGVALIAALLGVVVVSGVVIVLVATAVFQSRVTGRERQFETAVHAAEAATDDVIVNVNLRLNHFTTYDGSGNSSEAHVYLEHDGVTYTDEKAWARAVGDDLSTQTVVTRTGFGEAVGIRPLDAAGGDEMDLLFGVGYIPDREGALNGQGQIRVLKLHIQPGRFAPAQAFLVNGDLTLGGGAQTSGITGNVHANGDIFVEGQSGDCSGSGLCVRGRLSATGSLRKGPAPTGPDFTSTEREQFDLNHVCPTDPDGSPNTPPCGPGNVELKAARHQVPSFHASTFYDPTKQLNRDPATNVDTRWWILCPGGNVKKPGPPDVHPRTVCNSATYPVFWNGQTNNFHGWVWRNSCGEFNNKPCWEGDKIVSGAYFVYDANAVSNGGRGSVSIFASCSGAGFTDAQLLDLSSEGRGLNPCDGQGDRNGNYVMKGKPDFKPALPGVHFIADRDIIVNGQAGTQIDGLIAAREQARTEGSGDLSGSIIADDCHDRAADGTCNIRHSTGSIVGENSAKGNFIVSYNERIRLPLPGITHIVSWNEL